LREAIFEFTKALGSVKVKLSLRPPTEQSGFDILVNDQDRFLLLDDFSKKYIKKPIIDLAKLIKEKCPTIPEYPILQLAITRLTTEQGSSVDSCEGISMRISEMYSTEHDGQILHIDIGYSFEPVTLPEEAVA
jgi:hypothetical protein